MKNLLNVIAGLRHWQKQQQSEGHSVTHRCLEAVRACCHAEGLELPPSVGHADTALDCFENLEADPRKWGWFQIHHDAIGTLETPCLVFYGDCGTLPDGRKAGHIGLLGADAIIHSNQDYKVTPWWNDRLKGAFTPLG